MMIFIIISVLKELPKFRNRNVYSINSCISTSSHPNILEFVFNGPGSNVLRQNKKSNNTDGNGNTNVECYPFISILLAVGKTKIDFLSLGKNSRKVLNITG